MAERNRLRHDVVEPHSCLINCTLQVAFLSITKTSLSRSSFHPNQLTMIYTLPLIAALHSLAWAQAPTLPSNDPFYKTLSNISSYTPGQLINSRFVLPDLSTFSGISKIDVGGFHQFLYRTTDSLGDPVAAVTSLLVPKKPDSNKLLVYNTAYDTANNDCSPSYQLQAKSGNRSSEVLFVSRTRFVFHI